MNALQIDQREPTTLQVHTSVMFQPPAEGFAHILVQDNLNAPYFERGDVLLANLAHTEWRYDGIYVVELHGRQLVRYVMHRGGPKLYVYYQAAIGHGEYIDKADLKILASITAANTTRRVA